MIDFFEGWDLYQKLLNDDYLCPTDVIGLNGHELEALVYKLAKEHYNWVAAEPIIEPKPSEEYEKVLSLQTAESRLNHIYEIAIDWDGARSIRSLGNLVDEIIACTIPLCVTDSAALEQVKFTKMFEDIPDFLNNRTTTQGLPFTWTYLTDDISKVLDWAEEKGYEATLHNINYSSLREPIGGVITIKER